MAEGEITKTLKWGMVIILAVLLMGVFSFAYSMLIPAPLDKEICPQGESCYMFTATPPFGFPMAFISDTKTMKWEAISLVVDILVWGTVSYLFVSKIVEKRMMRKK